MIAPVFCAELASNHNGDLGRCVKLIRKADDAGFDAVKIQLFRVDRLYAPEILATRPDLAARRMWEVPPEWVLIIAEECERRSLRFVATPFDLAAVDLLAPHVFALKVSSYDILRLDLIRACAATGLDLIISTGMATKREIEAAVSAALDAQSLTLLHCVSRYPTPPYQANVRSIEKLREIAPAAAVGLSDHSRIPGVIYRAVHRHGAEWVELHIDDGKGRDSGPWCWSFCDARRLIIDIGDGFDADGVDQLPAPGQEGERDWRADPIDGLRPLRHRRNP